MVKDFPLPSNRSFGTLFVVVFALLAGLAWWHGKATAPWLAGVSGLFAIVTLLVPKWLTPLNKAWMGLALILNKIVSPIVLGILYYGMLTPPGRRHAPHGQGPDAPQARSRSENLLDHARPAGSAACVAAGPVLNSSPGEARVIRG